MLDGKATIGKHCLFALEYEMRGKKASEGKKSRLKNNLSKAAFHRSKLSDGKEIGEEKDAQFSIDACSNRKDWDTLRHRDVESALCYADRKR